MKIIEKQCTRCLEVKPSSEFNARKDTRSGLSSHCKACISASAAERYQRDGDRIRKRNSDWWKADPERARDTRRRSVVKNAEHRKLYAREYRKAKPEIKMAAERRWQQKNPDKYRACQLRKGATRRARLAAAPRVHFSAEQLQQRWEYYGGKCWMCPAVATEWDHVKPISKGGAHMLCNLRPSCRGCNATKQDQWPPL